MIRHLRIEGFAVVNSLEVEFGPGLNVVTGETGAGKSIVLGTLGLLAGARASTGSIRDGSPRTVVEAVFDTGNLPDLEMELERLGLSATDNELIVRREIGLDGRSRARVGGVLVSASALGELFDGRLEISSQHSSQMLLRTANHGMFLDSFGGLESLRVKLSSNLERLKGLEHERERLRQDIEEGARREDFLRFQIDEIDSAGISPGDFKRIDGELRRLRHVDRLLRGTASVLEGLRGDPMTGDALGAADQLGEASRKLEALCDIDSELLEFTKRSKEVATEVDDLAASIERYSSSVEDDPGRLAQLEERSLIFENLQRKYGDQEEEILEFRDRSREVLEGLAVIDTKIEELEKEYNVIHEVISKVAADLTKSRKGAAQALENSVSEGLGALAMSGAVFEVAFPPARMAEGFPCGPQGAETPEFLFSGNPGVSPRPLKKVASGGELSRLFLALKNALRETAGGMVLVFDEVDAGVGGAVADRVGSMLAELADTHQVICITHLPQIAARAERHLRLTKTVKLNLVETSIERLDGDARIEEIARMAGGEGITATTRRHARELLKGGSTIGGPSRSS